MEDPLVVLNDRSLSFSERCTLALSYLSTQPSKAAHFPRRNQILFDWLAGSLLKQAKGESPRAEVFLCPEVWTLFGVFLESLTQTTSKKRKLDDYRKCFDDSALVIKVPLLFVFQVTLQLISTSPEARIEQVILGFLSQNRSSLPVSLSQLVDFIKVLSVKRQHLTAFPQLLKTSLSIFSQIIVSGVANYKKSYPAILHFALNTEVSEEEEALWIDCWQRCLFPEVDELLAMLKSDTVAGLLKASSTSVAVESVFPKTASIQKLLFVQFSQLKSCSARTLSSIYEAFLRSAAGKLDRQSAFNFLAFLIARCPAVQQDRSALAHLLAVLQSRGNEIYQQRNDEIYRGQSEVIQSIFEAALKEKSYTLLLQVARLNYYLVLDKFPELELDASIEAKELLTGMFELAAQANQMPSFVQSLCARSTLEFDEISLAALFARSIPVAALYNIYNSLADCQSSVKRALIRSVLKNVDRLLDARLLAKDQFCQLQRVLLKAKHFGLLTFLVRWTPTHVYLDEALFETKEDWPLSLILALKFKTPSRVRIEHLKESDDLQLIVDYLPVIAAECSSSVLKKTAKWLVQKKPELLVKLLKNPLFFEIEAFRKPFLARCKENFDFIADLPAEYFNDEDAVELVEAVIESYEMANEPVLRALLVSGHQVRSTVLESFREKDAFIKALLLTSEEGNLLSKCVEADKSGKLLKALLKQKPTLQQLACSLHYTTSDRFDSSINKKVKKLLPSTINERELDDLGVILEWLGAEVAAETLESLNLSNESRLMAFKLRFCSGQVNIQEALSLLKKTFVPNDQASLRKGIILAVKKSDQLSASLEFLLADGETWLQAISQLLAIPAHSQVAFTHFFAHFDTSSTSQDSTYFLPVLKSACQLKRGVQWSGALFAQILAKLRSRLVSDGEEVCAILKLLIGQHWKSLRGLSALLVALLVECLQLPQLESSLARTVHELAGLRVGEVDAFSLLPLLHAFTRSSWASRSKPLLLAVNNLLRHFSSQSQLFQVLSSALIVDEEQRLVLKAFLAEHEKFYKYSGRA